MEHLTIPERPKFVSYDSSETVVSASVAFIEDLEAQHTKVHKIDDFNEHHDSDAESIITIGNDATHDEKKVSMFMDDVDDFPEGGLKSYLVVLGSFLGLVPCFGLFNILGVIESYVDEHQLSNVDSSTVGWIFSVFLFHHIHHILLTAFGNGLLMSPLVSVVSHYFLQKRAFFSSLATLGGSFGGVIFPILLRELFPRLGFEWSMRIFALICGFLLLFSILLARERFNNSENYANETIKQRTLAYLSAFDFNSLKDLRFVFCAIGALFAEVSTVSLMTYFASYAIQRGFTIDDTYVLVTIVNAGTIPGRFITGYLADKLGRFNVIIVTIMLSGVVGLVLWMPFGYSLKVLYAYAAVYGFFSGSIFSLLPVCCGQICKTEEFGRRYSTMYFIVAFGTLVGVPIGGAIIGDKSITNYNYFIVYTAVAAFLSSTCYFLSRYFALGKIRLTAKF
ncbi:unnamed protein product [Wickerhamomyces anomalus]